MVEAARLSVVVDADISGAQRGLRSVTDEIEATQRSAHGLMDSFKQGLGIGAGVSVITGALAGIKGAFDGIIGSGIGLNSSMENVRAQLTAMTKDGGQAQAILAAIRKEADATPFAFNEMARSMTTLLPVARQTGESLMGITKIAEILAATHPEQGLEGAAFALREFSSGQVQSLADRFDLPRQQLERLQKEGVPAIEAVRRVLQDLGFDASLVAGLAETLTGRWSTFKDTLSGFTSRLTAPLFDALKDGLMGLQTLLERNSVGINAFMDLLGSGLAHAASAGINALLSLGQAAGNVFQMLGTGNAAGAFAAIGEGLERQIEGMLSFLHGVAESFFGAGVNLVEQIAGGMIAGANAALTAAINFVADLISSFFIGNSPPPAGPLARIRDGGARLMETYADGMRAGTSAVTDMAGDIGQKLISLTEGFDLGLGAATLGAKTAGQALADIGTTVDGVDDHIRDLDAHMRQLDRAADPLKNALEDVKNSLDDTIRPLQQQLDALRNVKNAADAQKQVEFDIAELKVRQQEIDARRSGNKDAVENARKAREAFTLERDQFKIQQDQVRLQHELAAIPLEENIRKAKEQAQATIDPLQDQLRLIDRQRQSVTRERSDWQGLKADIDAAIEPLKRAQAEAEKAASGGGGGGAKGAAAGIAGGLKSALNLSGIVDQAKDDVQKGVATFGENVKTGLANWFTSHRTEIAGTMTGTLFGFATLGPVGALGGAVLGERVSAGLTKALAERGINPEAIIASLRPLGERLQTFFASLASGNNLAATVNRALGDLIPPGLNQALDAVDATAVRFRQTLAALGPALLDAATREATFVRSLLEGKTLAESANRAFGDLIPPSLNKTLDEIDGAFARIKTTLAAFVSGDSVLQAIKAGFADTFTPDQVTRIDAVDAALLRLQGSLDKVAQGAGSGGLTGAWKALQDQMSDFAPTGQRVEVVLTDLNNLSKALTDIQTGSQAALQKTGAALFALIEPAAQAGAAHQSLADLVNRTSEFLFARYEAHKKAFMDLVGVIQAGAKLQQQAHQLIQDAATTAIAAIGVALQTGGQSYRDFDALVVAMLDDAVQAVNAAVKAMGEAFGRLDQAVRGIVGPLVAQVTSWFDDMLSVARSGQDTLKGIVETVQGFLSNIQGALSVAQSIVSNFPRAPSAPAAPSAPGLPSNIGSGPINNVTPSTGGGGNSGGGGEVGVLRPVGGGTANIQSLQRQALEVNRFTQAANAAMQTFAQTAARVFPTVHDAVMSVSDVVGDAMRQIREMFGQAAPAVGSEADKTIDNLNKMLRDLKNAGLGAKQLEGFAKSITDAKNALVTGLDQLASAARDTLNKTDAQLQKEITDVFKTETKERADAIKQAGQQYAQLGDDLTRQRLDRSVRAAFTGGQQGRDQARSQQREDAEAAFQLRRSLSEQETANVKTLADLQKQQARETADFTVDQATKRGERERDIAQQIAEATTIADRDRLLAQLGADRQAQEVERKQLADRQAQARADAQQQATDALKAIQERADADAAERARRRGLDAEDRDWQKQQAQELQNFEDGLADTALAEARRRVQTELGDRLQAIEAEKQERIRAAREVAEESRNETLTKLKADLDALRGTFFNSFEKFLTDNEIMKGSPQGFADWVARLNNAFRSGIDESIGAIEKQIDDVNRGRVQTGPAVIAAPGIIEASDARDREARGITIQSLTVQAGTYFGSSPERAAADMARYLVPELEKQTGQRIRVG